ncbi:hypothetical protein ACV35F_34280, partial [Pseudomonas aeruginosa]
EHVQQRAALGAREYRGVELLLDLLGGARQDQAAARANEEIEKKLNSAVFPGAQGGPLMHVIAAKAVCFKEALEPGFKDYQAQVIRNAKAMAEVFIGRGY